MTPAKFPGRIKNKLADLLGDQGFDVSPWDLDVIRETLCGGDGIRWECYGFNGDQRVRIYSFDTMSHCARSGIVLHDMERSYEQEVSASK